MLAPTLLVGEKYIQLEYDDTQIIDEYTGNELFLIPRPNSWSSNSESIKKATKATRSIMQFSESETQIIDEKTDNELFFWFHRPNGWSSNSESI